MMKASTLFLSLSCCCDEPNYGMGLQWLKYLEYTKAALVKKCVELGYNRV